MNKEIEKITYSTIRIASTWTKSIGDFRIRLLLNFDTDEVEAFTYSGICFEKAENVESEKFQLEEHNLEPVKEWLDGKYTEFSKNEGDKNAD